VPEERGDSDPLDPGLLDAIDGVASGAPGVEYWPYYLVHIAQRLSQHHKKGRPLPPAYETLRYYAYLPLYLPRYVPRLRHTLRSADLRFENLLRIREGPFRILDVGCGPGTLSIAALDQLQQASSTSGQRVQIELVGQDRSPLALDVFQKILKHLLNAGRWPSLDLDWRCECGELSRAATVNRAFDIVLLGHVVCELCQELEPDAAFQIIHAVLEGTLSDRGIAVIIEPVQQDRLDLPLQLRDSLRASSTLHIFGPCLGSSPRCPEWSRPGRDTCSSSTGRVRWRRNTTAGTRLATFMKSSGLCPIETGGNYVPRSRLAFSGLVVGHGHRDAVPERVGTIVRRYGETGRQFVCCVGDDGAERLLTIERSGHDPRHDCYATVRLDGSATSSTPWQLSALYPRKGWP